METANGEPAGTDVQSYLATFNKEISSGGPQAAINQQFIIQHTDLNNVDNVAFFWEHTTYTDADAQDEVQNKIIKPEQEEKTLAHVDQPLLTPAAPTLTTEQDEEGRHVVTLSGAQFQQLTTSAGGIITQTQQGTIMVSPSHDGGDSSDAAVQVLASVAATSIPQPTVDAQMHELVAIQGENDSSQPQLVAVQTAQGTTQPQLVTVQRRPGITQAGQQMVTAANQQPIVVQPQAAGDGQDSVVLNTGNSYQTVTIVPSEVNQGGEVRSEVNQGGEVSEVLIVSQPDEQGQARADPNLNLDMSVFDFKEDNKGVGGQEEDEPEVAEGGFKKIIKVTPKKTSHGMQAQLMCNYCNYTSPKRYLLTRHTKTHSEERPYKCNICYQGFKTVASLQNHINTHTGVRPHKCKECEAAFTTSGELVSHVRYRHTFEKPHHCTECDYCSVELSKLKRHLRSHTGERPYECPHCSYASPDTFKLKRHLRIHTGEKPYECEICRARFTQSNSLKAHRLIHTGNKPVFQCELCPTTCGRKTDLKRHVQKLHPSEKPMQCKKCGKSFPDRYTYKIHLKTHEGEKCYKCELCPYAALSQRHLESHILTHTGEKPFTCDECDHSFRQKQLLKRHKNLYHTPDYVPPPPREKTHECSECHKYFAHRGNLLQHMQLHDPENAAALREEMVRAGYVEGQEGSEDEDLDEDDLAPDEEAIQQIIITPAAGAAHTRSGQVQMGEEVQEVQVQLVTVDGENRNATQIFLQMDDGAAEEEEEEDVEAPGEVETPPPQTKSPRRGRRASKPQPQVSSHFTHIKLFCKPKHK